MKVNIEIEIENIKVYSTYYEFDFKILVNGRLKVEDKYNRTHSWYEDLDRFRNMLKDGWAYESVLEDYCSELF